MAGRRQHFVPRFVQAGFASRTEGEKVFTWLYRKRQPPRECSTRDVGVESGFYSTPEDTAADDAITDAEGPFSALVGSLRDSAAGAVSNPEIPALIAHLEVRTRHIRENLAQAGEEFVSQTVQVLAGHLERKLQSNQEAMLKQPILAALAQKGYSPKRAKEVAVSLLPRAMEEVARPAILPFVEELRRRAPELIRSAARSGQIRALKEEVSPAQKTARFAELKYTIANVSSGNMILGDSIVLFEVEGPRRYKTLLEGKDALKAVYLPLAPARVLVGAPDAPCSLVHENLRGEVGRSSFEYFISHEETDANAALQGRIGENAPLLSAEEMNEIVTKLTSS